jgi:hypothetical protein
MRSKPESPPTTSKIGGGTAFREDVRDEISSPLQKDDTS